MYKYQRVEKFRRQQSPLWNAIHPSIVSLLLFGRNTLHFVSLSQDYEMNIEELEKALRQINGNLISTKECQFLKCVCLSRGREKCSLWTCAIDLQILKIPGVKRINLKVFSLIAALSEKVNQIE